MTAELKASRAATRRSTHKADICLLVEGCYPYVSGGVSSWIDWLMRTQPERSFAAVAIVADCQARHLRYQFPDNLTHFSELVLQSPRRPKRIIMSLGGSADDQELAGLLTALIRGGGLAEFARVSEIINRAGRGLSLQDLLETRLTLNVIRNMYDAVMPHASFLQFYWAWRALFGGLFSASKFSVPDASAYHCISTGYAGLVAARATLETGRPAALTEHGIYTNERRIEILMAEWIADTVEKGLAFDDARTDIRDLWIQVFEAYARITYQACTSITTLYRDNQELQLALGADADRLEIIPNGIDVGRFAKLSVASVQDRPTIALIGRVVPIKDVKTFIAAAALVRRTCPQLRALVMGPNDEDSDYFNECKRLTDELDLSGCVEFTGNVQITTLLPSVHVVVLTSLSEAQPLVLLEAGAAGIPCVATNVGACREIIEGTSDQTAVPGRGGFVTDLVAPEQIADRVRRLLESEPLRRCCGETMRRRVHCYYASHIPQQKYAQLYRKLLDLPACDPTRRTDNGRNRL